MVVFGGTRVACRVCILTKLVLAHDNEQVYQIEMNSAIDYLIDDDASKTLARKISRKWHIEVDIESDWLICMTMMPVQG